MIYLDHHAATPLCGAALQAMSEARARSWANPASRHQAGQKAAALLERARVQVARALAARQGEIVFTSGGTEACNLGIRGLAENWAARVITTRIEHPAVARTAQALGLPVEHLQTPWLPNLERILARSASSASHDNAPPTLVAIQWVNHDTGAILPIEAIVAATRPLPNVRLFVDASQALGKVPISLSSQRPDAMALASHKVGGPAGAGALFVAHGTDLGPHLLGGGQESGRRAGTPALEAVVGFGAACAEVDTRLESMPRLRGLRRSLEETMATCGGVLNGSEPNVATAINASFSGIKGETLVAALDLEGVCASSGPACSSGLSGPSEVLLALFPDQPWRAESALRLSLGPETTRAETTQAAQKIKEILSRYKR